MRVTVPLYHTRAMFVYVQVAAEARAALAAHQAQVCLAAPQLIVVAIKVSVYHSLCYAQKALAQVSAENHTISAEKVNTIFVFYRLCLSLDCWITSHKIFLSGVCVQRFGTCIRFCNQVKPEVHDG